MSLFSAKYNLSSEQGSNKGIKFHSRQPPKKEEHQLKKQKKKRHKGKQTSSGMQRPQNHE